MDSPLLHPDLEPLAFLLGTWSGAGRGDYPTIEAFEYVETVTFGHVGKPFIAYTQRTRDASAGTPLHAESGYIRPVDEISAELVLVQPSGIVEVDLGRIDGTTVTFESDTVLTTPTAKDVTAVRRAIRVAGDELSYVVDMAAVGQPLTFHLEATLTRDS